MTAMRIADRPFLRMFDPESDTSTSDEWTVQRAFDELRWPNLQKLKSASSGTRILQLWGEFERELAEAQRISDPLRLSDVTSKHLLAFQEWLSTRFPLPKGASTIKKACGEIALVLRLAADAGCEVHHIRKPKPPKVRARPRYSIDDEDVQRLWDGCQTQTWPPKTAILKKGCEFIGTGVEPTVFMRAVIILLRCYGMRVQDLVSYSLDKQPLRWRDISFDPRSPNPESNERWPLGWLYYLASKTEDSSAREYYLPLMPAARAAIDRLRSGALEHHGGNIPPDAKVFLCPKSHGFTARFKMLQQTLGITTRGGDHYIWEDFRKTVASYSAVIHDGLPDALCGWQARAGVRGKNYQLPEILLVRKLHLAPLPACFDQWVDPAQAQAVADWCAAEYA